MLILLPVLLLVLVLVLLLLLVFLLLLMLLIMLLQLFLLTSTFSSQFLPASSFLSSAFASAIVTAPATALATALATAPVSLVAPAALVHTCTSAGRAPASHRGRSRGPAAAPARRSYSFSRPASCHSNFHLSGLKTKPNQKRLSEFIKAL